mgnify:CR=1 FL=1
MSTSKIICTIIYVVFILGTFYTVGNVSQFFDINSFIFVAIVGILYSFSVKGEETYIHKFGDGAVRAGWLGSLIGIVSILGSPVFAGSTSNLEALGAALAIASLTVMYGYFFKLGSIILD